VDEILLTLAKILRGLRVNEGIIQRNLRTFGPFAAVERVLMAAVKAGADRQKLHEVLRRLSMSAWQSIQDGQGNPLVEAVAHEPALLRWLPETELRALFSVVGYTGIAAPAARELAAQIREQFKK
jgi:adenylosuccinate lyase